MCVCVCVCVCESWNWSFWWDVAVLSNRPRPAIAPSVNSNQSYNRINHIKLNSCYYWSSKHHSFHSFMDWADPSCLFYSSNRIPIQSPKRRGGLGRWGSRGRWGSSARRALPGPATPATPATIKTSICVSHDPPGVDQGASAAGNRTHLTIWLSLWSLPIRLQLAPTSDDCRRQHGCNLNARRYDYLCCYYQ